MDINIFCVVFGCWGFVSDKYWGECDEVVFFVLIDVVLEVGINFFDIVEMYVVGVSEELFGKVMKGCCD